MHSDLLSCCICYNTFNYNNHLPKLLPSCGHTICSTCLVGILSKIRPSCCPIDRILFPLNIDKWELFPTNMLVLQLLEEKLKLENDFCEFHREVKNFICTNDRHKLCQYCIGDRIHRGHNIKRVSDVRNEADVKKRQLESLLEDFDRHQGAIDGLLREEKKNLIVGVQDKFDKIRELLASKEKELYSEIDSAFAVEKMEIDAKIEKDLTLRKSIQAKISDLVRPTMDERFFRTLVAPVHMFNIKEELARLFKVAEMHKNRFGPMLENLGISIATILRDMHIPSAYDDGLEATGNIDLENNEDPRILRIKSQLKIESQDDQLMISPISTPASTNTGESLPSRDQLKKTTHIDMAFDQSKLTEEAFESMKSVCTSLKDINSLEISFANRVVTDQELGIFCSDPFWATEKISSFSLDLDKSKVSDQSVIKLMTNGLSKMTHMKCFSILLCDTKITDKSLAAFATQVLPAMAGLRDLNLDLCNTQLTDAGLMQLFLRMREGIKNMQMFRLCVSSTKVADKSLELFSKEVLPTMPVLDAFKLYLYDTQITDAGVEYLCNPSNVWRNIKSFVLSIGKTGVTDKSVVMVSKNILSTVKDLETFGLFLDNSRITDEGIKQLYFSMRNIVKNMKVFKLNFENTGITDKSIEALTKQILPNLTNIKEFELNLSGTQVTDKSMKHFCLLVKQMFKALERFSLTLKHTRVTDASIKELVSGVDLASIVGFKSFSVDLDENQVSEEIQSILRSVQQNLLIKRE